MKEYKRNTHLKNGKTRNLSEFKWINKSIQGLGIHGFGIKQWITIDDYIDNHVFYAKDRLDFKCPSKKALLADLTELIRCGFVIERDIIK